MSHNDLVFRPPLLPPTFAQLPNWEEDHDNRVAPMISAVLVACRVLRLSEEATFAAACLLHRFYLAQQTHRQQTNNSTTPELVAKSSSDDKNEKPQPKAKAKEEEEEEGTRRSEEEEERRLELVSCIFVVSKTHNEPRRLRDFINLSQMLSWDNDNSSHKHTLHWKKDPPALDERYWAIKESIVATEQTVLRWLAFDTHVSPVHRAVVALVQQQQEGLEEVNVAELVETASHLLNHSALYSSRALSVPVVPLATAALQLAWQRCDMTSPLLYPFKVAEDETELAETARSCMQTVLAAQQSNSETPTLQPNSAGATAT